MTIGSWVLNGLDIIILLVCLISFMMAFSKGLAKELISLVALLVAIIATLFAWGQFRPQFRAMITGIEADWLVDRFFGVVVFFLTYIIVSFLLRNVTGTESKPAFGNRLLGGGFGILRGLFIVAVITLLWNQSYRENLEIAEQYGSPVPVRSSWFENSTIYPYVEKIENFIVALPLPEIKKAAKDLADGNTEGAIEGAKDIIDDKE